MSQTWEELEVQRTYAKFGLPSILNVQAEPGPPSPGYHR